MGFSGQFVEYLPLNMAEKHYKHAKRLDTVLWGVIKDHI